MGTRETVLYFLKHHQNIAMNYLVYFIISFLFFSCSKNIKISEMDKSYNARILQIMNENSSYKFNYFYYEIKNYTHKDYSKVAYEIEDFIDNSYISSIAKNKRAEIYCFFYTKRWWYRRINLNDTEEISDNGLIYDRDLIALVEFILDENKNYIKKIIVYNKKEIMYERKEILD